MPAPAPLPATATAAPGALLCPSVALGPGLREEAVAFTVAGERVCGQLILPAQPAPVALLFLHGWGGVRGGPHDLLTTLARTLGDTGVASLRFDFRGRGDSEGDGLAASLAGMAEDGLAAAALLQQRTGVKRLLLVGICSGGNVGIGMLDRLPSVSGLFLLSVYPFGDGDSFRRDAQRSAHFLREYTRKLLLGSTWRRLVRGEVDLAAVWRVLSRPLRRRFAKKSAAASATSVAVPSPSAPATPPASSPLDHLRTRKMPVQMLYGGADPDYAASLAYYQAFATRHHYPLTFTTLPGASHNFYSLAWKAELAERLQQFVKEQCP